MCAHGFGAKSIRTAHVSVEIAPARSIVSVGVLGKIACSCSIARMTSDATPIWSCHLNAFRGGSPRCRITPGSSGFSPRRAVITLAIFSIRFTTSPFGGVVGWSGGNRSLVLRPPDMLRNSRWTKYRISAIVSIAYSIWVGHGPEKRVHRADDRGVSGGNAGTD